MPGYSNLVAGFLTDLNPGASDTSTIRYTSTPEALVVKWDSLALYSSTRQFFTFSVELRPPAYVRIAIEDMVEIANVPDAPRHGDAYIPQLFP